MLLVSLLIAAGCKDRYEHFISENPYSATEIIKPADSSFFSPGDTIEIQGMVRYSSRYTPEIQIQWKSNRDGVLKTEYPNAGRTYTLITSTLSEGSHTIYLMAMTPEGYWSSDSIHIINQLPPKVILKSIDKRDNSATLHWTKYYNDDFVSYEIYRNTYENAYQWGEKIGTLTNISDTSFVDSTLIISKNYFYQVVVQNKFQLRKPSNELMIVSGIFYEYGKILRIKMDHGRGYIYAQTPRGLLFINSKTMVAEDSIIARVLDFDMDKAEKYMYFSKQYEQKIYRVDMNTRKVISEIPTSRDVDQIACGRSDRLYYQAYTNYIGSNPVLCIDLNSGAEIGSTFPKEMYNGDMSVHPDGNTLYVGESQISSSGFVVFDISTDSFQLIYDWWGNTFAEPYVLMSNSGSLVYWENALMDDKLSYSNTCSKIFDFSSDDKFALSWSKLMNTETRQTVKEIRAEYNFGVYNNDKELFLYFEREQTSSDKAINRIYRYSL